MATAVERYERSLVTSPCRHFSAVQVGVVEAALRRGGWIYRTAYRCPDCGSYFTETHAQTAARNR